MSWPSTISRAAAAASLAELVDWLHQYAELPIADRIYRLAVQKASKRVKKRHHRTVIVMTAERAGAGRPGAPPRRRL
ncbi:MAG: hypothetical protein WDM81_17485 [Rhizomicrobium sp.]